MKSIKLKKGPKLRISGNHNYFVQWYTLELDKEAEDFVLRKEEVEEVRWFSKEELIEKVRLNPEMFTPNTAKNFKLFF